MRVKLPSADKWGQKLNIKLKVQGTLIMDFIFF